MVTDSVSASSSPIVTFPDESDDELESESVPLLTITNDAGTVLDRSLIPVEHGILPVVSKKRGSEDYPTAVTKRFSRFGVPAIGSKRKILPDDSAAPVPSSKRFHMSNFVHTALFSAPDGNLLCRRKWMPIVPTILGN
ncbi:unnamed protein product [[Candida] boidinii]|nr:unnamed protein product [[Candida] boidinii]